MGLVFIFLAAFFLIATTLLIKANCDLKLAIKESESTLKIYRERNKQLEDFQSECEELKLKVKCMDMYINDDEAILELMELSRTPSSHDVRDRLEQKFSTAAYLGGYRLGGLGGLGGLGWR